ncbi:MAG TPA: hypothetical protein VJ506_01985 [Candidatus Limnocylindrales bacterium]|nr:hypothetical protein [Candidatus Limnocylindrales bacterium]
MRRPLGCLTGTAFIAAIGALVLGLGLAVVSGNGIFSPGALNAVTGQESRGGVRSHADLATRCDACHTAPWDASRMADRCLACHTEVGEEFSSGSGLHGLMATGGQCRGCHTDHHGLTASLTVANPSGFPHARTGFALTAHPIRGEGGSFSCSDCHVTSLTTFSVATCRDCHQHLAPAKMTPHVETFGERCLACHDGIDTYGAAFAHLTWPLVGGHVQAACGSCHAGARDLVALRDTSPACISCHRQNDIHAGRLGTSCETCHSATSWSDATVDHDRTTFPLTGRHVGLACQLCHVNQQWTGIGTTCVACHARDDAHQGRFGTGCGTCHTTAGWADATFDHSKSGFPLTGAHAAAPCQACHANGVFQGTPTTCASCHSKPATHIGSFSSCGTCHTTTAWLPASFRAGHAFPMTHGGAGSVCSTCHPSSWGSWTCTHCHSNSVMAAAHSGIAGYSSTGCVRCHPTGASGG